MRAQCDRVSINAPRQIDSINQKCSGQFSRGSIEEIQNTERRYSCKINTTKTTFGNVSKNRDERAQHESVVKYISKLNFNETQKFGVCVNIELSPNKSDKISSETCVEYTYGEIPSREKIEICKTYECEYAYSFRYKLNNRTITMQPHNFYMGGYASGRIGNDRYSSWPLPNEDYSKCVLNLEKNNIFCFSPRDPKKQKLTADILGDRLFKLLVKSLQTSEREAARLHTMAFVTLDGTCTSTEQPYSGGALFLNARIYRDYKGEQYYGGVREDYSIDYQDYVNGKSMGIEYETCSLSTLNDNPPLDQWSNWTCRSEEFPPYKQAYKIYVDKNKQTLVVETNVPNRGIVRAEYKKCEDRLLNNTETAQADNILDFHSYPALLNWLDNGGSEPDAGLLFQAISRKGGKTALTNLLNKPTNKNIDFVAAIFSSASYFPSAVVRELFESLGFTTIYTDIDFHTQDEDSMMFEYTNTSGQNFKFWAITGSEGNKIGPKLLGHEQSPDWKQNFTFKGLAKFPSFVLQGHTIKVQGQVFETLIEKSNFIFTTMFNEVLMNPDVNLENSKIVITGHSQGGMVGAIIAAILQEYFRTEELSSEIELITFGSPRWGDRIFKQRYEAEITARNFLHTDDQTHILALRHGLMRFGKKIPFKLNKDILSPIDDHNMLRNYLKFFE